MGCQLNYLASAHTQGRPDSRPSSRSRMRGSEDTATQPSLPYGSRSPQLSPVPSPPTATTTTAATAAPDVSPMSVRYVGCAHSNMVLASLNDLRIHRELCDIELVVDDVRIPAHKSVLCACSPYFKAMFTSCYTESNQSSVVIREVSFSALELLVQYFYTSEVFITTSNVQELLSASCMFQVTALKEACCEFMQRHLGVTNCLGVRAVADLHSCTQLKKVADNFAKKNFTSIIESDEFLKLEVDHLVELFSADDLGASSEEKVYEAVMIWINHDLLNREQYLEQLLEKVSSTLKRKRKNLKEIHYNNYDS